MAHKDQLDFVTLVRQCFPSHFEDRKVLEIGSMSVNESVRSCFTGGSYVGVDVAPGPGVDQVCQGQLLGYPSESFDTVISCECLEHNPFWVETVSNMFRMVKPGGLVIVSCATVGRAEHGTMRTSTADSSPLSVSIGWEYYRNIPVAEFGRTFGLDGWCDGYVLLPNWQHCDLYFVGLRRPSAAGEAMSSLRRNLKARFRPTGSLRSLAVCTAASLFGEPGVGALRSMWRLGGSRR